MAVKRGSDDYEHEVDDWNIVHDAEMRQSMFVERLNQTASGDVHIFDAAEVFPEMKYRDGPTQALLTRVEFEYECEAGDTYWASMRLNRGQVGPDAPMGFGEWAVNPGQGERLEQYFDGIVTDQYTHDHTIDPPKGAGYFFAFDEDDNISFHNAFQGNGDTNGDCITNWKYRLNYVIHEGEVKP